MFLCFNFTTFPNYTVLLLRYLTLYSPCLQPTPLHYRQVAHVSTLWICGEQHTISRKYKKRCFSIFMSPWDIYRLLTICHTPFQNKMVGIQKLAWERFWTTVLVCFSLDYIGALITLTLICIFLYVHGTFIGCFELGGAICILEIKCRLLKSLLNI